jgi:hypothetical protein
MGYLVPFKGIIDRLGLHALRNGGDALVNSSDVLGAIKMLLLAVDVDEDWYRQTYPDVDEAIGQKVYASARQHFVEHGYFEGRRPAELAVDEDWYIAHYSDVALGIDSKEIESASEHYNRHGYAEGRMPSQL